MKRITSLTTVAALGFVFVFISLVSAHDLWLVPMRFDVAPGGKVAVALNTGDQFPVSEGAVKAERIERATLVTAAGGSTPPTAFRTEGKSSFVDVTAPREQGGAIVEVLLTPVATKQPRASFDEFVKHEGLDAVGAQLARETQRRIEERRTYTK